MGLLDAGSFLEDRLRSQCASVGGNVFTTESLAGVKERAQVTPALHLVLHGYEKADGKNGSGTLWKEIWLVVAVVKNARQGPAQQAALRAAAAPILVEVLAGLDGWRCPGAASLVNSLSPPKPLYTDSFGYFPLAFELAVATAGCDLDL